MADNNNSKTDTKLLAGKTGDWEVVIGIETHAQISSKAKLFSAASADFGAPPNSHVSLVDAAMPGMLPVLNKFCVEQAVRTGLGLNAKINLTSRFDRKNYFYADLPQGYQISQYQQPIVGKGRISIDLADGSTKEIGIERLHLEQDAGKSLHDQHPDKSYIDLNRSGVGLMEIVSEPDLRSADEAAAYVAKLRAIMRFLGVCDGNMEQGSLRADCNVSVRRAGEGDYGTRTETKNLNSLRFIAQAINYEAARQIALIEGGGAVVQETRLFDTASGETRAMRTKEDAHDYRYFPDPDLMPLVLEEAWVEKLRAGLPELPDALRGRLVSQYGLGEYDASLIAGDPLTAEYYETMADGRDRKGAKLAANWLLVELFGAMNKAGVGLEACPIASKDMAGLLNRLEDGTVSGPMAKKVFAIMFDEGSEAGDGGGAGGGRAGAGKLADAIIEREGLRQVTDEGAVAGLVDEVLAAEADKLAEYRGGKEKLFGFFVGQVMKASRGQASPEVVNRVLKARLGGKG